MYYHLFVDNLVAIFLGKHLYAIYLFFTLVHYIYFLYAFKLIFNFARTFSFFICPFLPSHWIISSIILYCFYRLFGFWNFVWFWVLSLIRIPCLTCLFYSFGSGFKTFYSFNFCLKLSIGFSSCTLDKFKVFVYSYIIPWKSFANCSSSTLCNVKLHKPSISQGIVSLGFVSFVLYVAFFDFYATGHICFTGCMSYNLR